MNTTGQSRREFLAIVGGAAAVLLGCGGGAAEGTELPGNPVPTARGSARLLSRPGSASIGITPGTWGITSTPARDGSLIVPSSYVAGTPMPLMVAFHGATGSPAESISRFGALAESRGFLLLALGSRGLTWDAMTGPFGRDVAFIDTALKFTFDRCNVDTSRIVVEGFSDGASYALAIALANGDLFRRAVANSPGYIPDSDSPPVGTPSFFFSHGRQDPILNIDQASRTLVPMLRTRGYDVFFTEFDGGHTVPASVTLLVVDWMLA